MTSRTTVEWTRLSRKSSRRTRCRVAGSASESWRAVGRASLIGRRVPAGATSGSRRGPQCSATTPTVSAAAAPISGCSSVNEREAAKFHGSSFLLTVRDILARKSRVSGASAATSPFSLPRAVCMQRCYEQVYSPKQAER